MTNRAINDRRLFLYILLIATFSIFSFLIFLRFGPSEQNKIKYLKEYVSYMFASEEKRIEIEKCRLERRIKALKSDNPSERRIAAQALMLRNDLNTVWILIDALNDRDAMVRSYAVQALGQIQNPVAVEHIISVLDDEYYGVRRGAVFALNKLKDPRAIIPLINRLVDEDEPVRSSARDVLIALTGAQLCEAPGNTTERIGKFVRGMVSKETPKDRAELEKCQQEWQQWWEQNKTRFQ